MVIKYMTKQDHLNIQVVWDIVTENGTACAQSYSGDYSTPGDAQVPILIM